MIKLKDYLECINHKCGENVKFQWKCFGNNAYMTDNWYDEESTHNSTISIVYDFITHIIYEMQAWDAINNRYYRWIRPEYVDAYKLECKTHNCAYKHSIDNWEFIDLEVEQDILEKAKGIVLGKEYDTRVMSLINLSNADTVFISNLAEQANMSLKEYIGNILEQTIIVEKLKGLK